MKVIKAIHYEMVSELLLKFNEHNTTVLLLK